MLPILIRSVDHITKTIPVGVVNYPIFTIQQIVAKNVNVKNHGLSIKQQKYILSIDL